MCSVSLLLLWDQLAWEKNVSVYMSVSVCVYRCMCVWVCVHHSYICSCTQVVVPTCVSTDTVPTLLYSGSGSRDGLP